MLANKTIKAIQTRYAGCFFRSRLEARWAVFFNALDIQWEYEPEGFDLESGRYLPDFLLPSIRDGGVWFEVKPSPAAYQREKSDEEQWKELAIATGRPLMLAMGMPRSEQVQLFGCGDPRSAATEWWPAEGGWDSNYQFCKCCQCGKIGIEFDGRGARVCGSSCPQDTRPEADRFGCPHGNHDKCYSANAIEFVLAYRKAQSARFEFGERG